MRPYRGHECKNRYCYNKAEANGRCRRCNRVTAIPTVAVNYVRQFGALRIPPKILTEMVDENRSTARSKHASASLPSARDHGREERSRVGRSRESVVDVPCPP